VSRGDPLQAYSADLWCADYKGEFMLANKRLCHPFTVSDFASRYLIGCDGLATNQAAVRVPECRHPGGRREHRARQYNLACLITKLKREIGKLPDAVALGLLGPRHILA
jgi:hypothetical protein